MRGSEFYPFEAGGRAILDNGLDVPILSQIVSDSAQLHLGRLQKKAWKRAGGVVVRSQRRQQPEGARAERGFFQEGSAIRFHSGSNIWFEETRFRAYCPEYVPGESIKNGVVFGRGRVVRDCVGGPGAGAPDCQWRD